MCALTSNIPIDDLDQRVRALPFNAREMVRDALEMAEFWATHRPVCLPPIEIDHEIAQHMRNLRGFSTWELVAEQQYIVEQIEAVESGIMNELGAKWLMGYMEAINREVRRRESVYLRVQADPRQIEVKALKELCVGSEWYNLAGHYADVVVMGAYKYRCALHGDGKDTDPSGALYPDGRWWCYGCNKGGDQIDWLMTYGRLAFKEAIALLNRMYGLGRGNGG